MEIHVTFSVVHPSICSLKDRLKSILNPAEEEEYEEYIVSELNQIEEDSEIMQLDNENELLLNIENIPDNEHADEVIIAVPGTRKKVNISNPINTNNLKIQILKILLTSIDKYWNFSSELSSVSSILDPRLKRLNHLSSTKKNKAKWLLESEFQSLKNNQEHLASTSTIPSCSAHNVNVKFLLKNGTSRLQQKYLLYPILLLYCLFDPTINHPFQIHHYQLL